MNRRFTALSAAAAIALGGCHRPAAEEPQIFVPDKGGYMSVDTGVADTSALLMAIQAKLLAQYQAHPEFVGQVHSHGAASQYGYFFKFRGACAAPPPLAEMARAMIEQESGQKVRCEDIDGR